MNKQCLSNHRTISPIISCVLLGLLAFMQVLHGQNLLTFSSADAGRLFTDDGSQNFLGGVGFTVAPTGNNGQNLAAIYDISLTGGEDPDLEGPYTQGNAQNGSSESIFGPLGGLMILQEYATLSEIEAGMLSLSSGMSIIGAGANDDGGGSNDEGTGPFTMNAPDDGGSGGFFILNFDEPLASFETLLADLEAPGDDNGTPGNLLDDDGARLVFRDLDDSGDTVAESVFFLTDATLSAAGLGNNDDSGDAVEHLGNNSLNVTPVLTAASFGMAHFDEIEVRFGSNSGGISFIRVTFAEVEANHSIGSTIFRDLNQDNFQNPGEPGIANVTVQLLAGIGGGILSTTQTDSQGQYLFDELQAGDYIVTIPDDQFDAGGILDPAVLAPVTPGALPLGGFDNSDNDVDTNSDGATIDVLDSDSDVIFSTFGSPVITLAPGTELTDADGEDTTLGGLQDNALLGGDDNGNMTVDFGFSDVLLASLGNLAFVDVDGDGTFTSGTDTPLAGVLVALLDEDGDPVNDEDGDPLTVTTGADGSYLFSGLDADNYIVKFTTPTVTVGSDTIDYVATLDSDTVDGTEDNTSKVDPLAGFTNMAQTPVITLSAGESDQTADAGFVLPASLGDIVFNDLNQDGLQGGAGEAGVAGVTVSLRNAADDSDVTDLSGTTVGSQTTVADGAYLFTNLAPGNYEVVFTTLPAGFVFTGQNAGGDAVDSDVNPTTGVLVADALVSGEEDLTNDAGIFQPASLGNLAFVDVDGDGTFTSGTDTPLAGVLVALLDEDGNPVNDEDGDPLTVTTGADGLYSFPDLTPDNYIVKFTTPTVTVGSDTIDYVATLDSDTVDGTEDNTSKVDPLAGFTNMAQTPVITLSAGENDPTADAGFVIPASLGDFVFNDLNQDGLQGGAGEAGVAGVTVSLRNAADDSDVTDLSGATVGSQTTLIDGAYLFTNLAPGNYEVVFTTIPTGFVFTGQNAGGDAVDSDVNPTTGVLVADALVSGEEDLTNDAGIFQPASLGNLAFIDVDGDGTFTSGTDTPLAGVLVALLDEDGNPVNDEDGDPLTVTTGADGLYSFPDLAPDNYIVKFTTPTVTVGSDTIDYVATLDSDTVDGTEDNTSKVDPLAGFTNMAQTPVITLSAGENDPTADAGFVLPASLGDFVFNDLNQDGLQGGTGEAGVAGVTVSLRNAADDSDVTDLSGATVGSQTTLADGAYLFTNLAPGNYEVVFTTIPAGFVFTGQNAGGDAVDSDVDPTTGVLVADALVSGEEDLTNDAGIFQPASLGNLAFVDVDGDGTFTSGVDTPLAGVLVALLDEDGNPVNDEDGDPLTVTTGADGLYSFPDLAPDNYIVKFTTPTVTVGSDTIDYVATLDSDTVDGTEDNTSKVDPLAGFTNMAQTPVITLSAGENDPTADAGFVIPASLGDIVFNDLNQDGLQGGPGEVGVAGVTVSLRNAADDSDVTDLSGATVGSQTTLADGAYLFTNLAPGNYEVVFTTIPTGFVFTGQNAGGDTVDSDVDPTTGVLVADALVSGEEDLTNDAGIFQPASLGNLAFVDVDGDGTFTSGVDTPLAGVLVALLDEDGNPVNDEDGDPLTVTTGADGLYSFPDLAPDNYIVKFTTPTVTVGSDTIDYVATIDSDTVDGTEDNTSKVDPLIGMPNMAQTPIITLSAGESDQTADAGFLLPASLGDIVFNDLNQDGLQGGTGEAGVAGVTVSLRNAADDSDVTDLSGATVGSQTTLADGAYLFTNLAPGNYEVVFTTLPLGYAFTDQNAGGDAVDSDVDPATGVLVADALVSGEEDLTNDAGIFIQKAQTYSDFLISNAESFNLGDNVPPGVPVSEGGVDTLGDDLDTSFEGNIDGDVFNNLLEYALCFNPGSGVKTLADGSANEGFHLELDGSDIDAVFTRPFAADTQLTYAIQSYDVDTATWADITTITESVVDNSDGTETVSFEGVNVATAAGDTKGLLRLRVDTSFTGVQGYQLATVRNFCQTYSDPLLTTCIFTGTITSVSGQVIDLSGSTIDEPLTNVLVSGTSYYLEVMSGDNEGHIFDIASFTGTSVTLEVDSDLCALSAPYSTLTTVPADLAGDLVVIRAHKTVDELFPRGSGSFVEGTGISDAGRILRLSRDVAEGVSPLVTYYADSIEDAWLNTDGGANVSDEVIPPGEAVFVHDDVSNPSFSIMQFGEVRTNQLAVPLKEGNNFVAPGHPVIDQSLNSGGIESRQLNNSTVDAQVDGQVKFAFIGDGARSRSDLIETWDDDSQTDITEVHLCYTAIFYSVFDEFNQWTEGGRNFNDENDSLEFECTRGVIYRMFDQDRPTYYIPSPIVIPSSNL